MKANQRGMPEIKICGITRTEEALYLNEVRAEYAGFVFWEKSKRNVSIARAKEIGRLLDKEIRRVAVTVSPDLDLAGQIEDAGFDILQVHGELEEEVIRQCGIPVWRACNLQEPEDMGKLERHHKISGYVIDAGTPGSGRTFGWAESLKAVEEMKSTVFAGKKFILAGGLNPGNIAEAVRMFVPDAVDVSSGVEYGQGKDRGLVQEFVKAARNAGESDKNRTCRKGER